MKKLFFLLAGVFALSCNERAKPEKAKQGTVPGGINITDVTDTLPDTPQFVIVVDEKEYSIDAGKIDAYMGTDSVITLYAKMGDTSGLQVVIPLKAQFPFSVPTGYSSKNTKIAFSEELAVLPTVILNNYPEVDISFNNLDDSYHKQDLKNDAITVTGYRRVENSDGTPGSAWQIKGHIHTTVLKNVYSGKDKPFNHDYKVDGRFVVRF